MNKHDAEIFFDIGMESSTESESDVSDMFDDGAQLCDSMRRNDFAELQDELKRVDELKKEH
ncbi:hypothetical protein HK407_06g10690 [Ordospora pajunii]|uniref:uncharacterized protein n=1 Tax=Ordospora pajunii TaxID=3039483 RepID=UPI0029526E7C|nr:uncharacterized protein HK407_06g10690 [Ordospora pajunii]KAH9411240.1 hypothetical protein HK407_06g10690 [Ordospora pajunii]